MAGVKLLHWNILFSEKPYNILRLVEQNDPDIFSCQEINEEPDDTNGASLVQRLSQLFPHHYFEPADLTGASGKVLKLGNAIFSKYPLSSKRKIVLCDKPNPTSQNKSEQRVYVEARADIDGHGLTVASTHLSFAPQFGDTPDRLEQISYIIDVLKDQKGSYVITGDFNSRPDTKIISDVRKYLVSAGPADSEPTFTTIPFSYLGFDVKGLDWRVDYIFVSRDIKVISSKIIQTKYSDHLPILAELEV